MINRIARASVVNPWGVPTREPNPALRPYTVRGSGGLPGLFDEMESGHPKIAKAYGDLATALADMSVDWVPVGDTEDEARFAEDLDSLWRGMSADVDNGLIGSASVLQYAALYWSRGSCIYAARWVPSGAADRHIASLNGLDLELYPVHPSSVTLWDTDVATGKLRGLRQSTSAGSAYIPAGAMIRAARLAVPGQWEGVSWMRPLAFLFERWKSVWLSSERNSWMMSGTITLVEPVGASEDDRARALDALDAWQNGLAPFLVLPSGWEVKFDAPSASDSMGTIDKIDAYIDGTLGNHVAALSYAAHATRALGDVVAEDAAQDAARELSVFLRMFGAAFAGWVADQVAYSGALPVLQLASIEDTATAGTVVADAATAKGAGLIAWNVEDERLIRQTIGLPVSRDLETAVDARPVVAAMSDHGGGCCSSVKMRQSLIEVIGADGRPFMTHSPLTGVERFVAWADNADARAGFDEALANELGAIAERHRRAVWRALRDGWQAGESDAVFQRFAPEYREALRRYGMDVARQVSRASVEEAVRQADAGGRSRDMALSVALFNRVSEAARERLARAESGLDIAADEVGQKVQSEVERAWRAGVKPGQFRSQLGSRALVSPAAAAANLIESEGRVLAAADMVATGEAEVLGVRPARVVRTSVMDRNRCEVCIALSQTVFELPAEMAKWEAMPLPDPNCEGGADRCRCGWLVEWSAEG
jgi:hypothetical protein